jgi:choline-sulfatase
MPPQLFDLDSDPEERHDLGTNPGYSGVAAECEQALRRMADLEAVDAQARADQEARIAAVGGRESILKKGSFGASPAPGTAPVYD